MAKYRKIAKVIEGIHQLVRGEPWPEGVHSDGPREMHVVTIQGQKVPIGYGEWVMPEGDGVHFYPCADSVFRSTYEAVEE